MKRLVLSLFVGSLALGAGCSGKKSGADAGTPSDSGASDSGAPDSGAPDSGTPDAGCAPHAGASCSGGVPCCAGLTCDAHGFCQQTGCSQTATCLAIGDACSADGGTSCCPGASCHGGFCQSATPPPPACAFDGQTCAQDADCCGNPDAGTRMACVTIDGGAKACHLGAMGEACDDTHPCAAGATCIASMPDGGVDGGPAAGGPGVCGITPTDITCNVTSRKPCQLGDACDPARDYCNSGSLTCVGGQCTLPRPGASCTGGCAQLPGDPHGQVCMGGNCVPACASDVDCGGAAIVDSQNANPAPTSLWCMSDAAGHKGCSYDICYWPEHSIGDVSALYKPCASHPASMCIPQYVGAASNVLGFCQAVRPAVDGGAGANATVGQVCDPFAGPDRSDLLCGSDAVCMAGVCQPICDVIRGQLDAGFPGCSATSVCIATQSVELTAQYQAGGCTTPCDPFTDAFHAGCAPSFCGGPLAKCQWIFGDRPQGYCAAQAKQPIPAGQSCTLPSSSLQSAVPDPCEPGAACLNDQQGGGVCVQLCGFGAAAGSPEATCPAGKQCCQLFTQGMHAGFCATTCPAQ